MDESGEDPEVQAWLEGALQERLETTDLYEELKDGTVLCRLMLSLQPNLDIGFHRVPETVEECLVNIQVFTDRCEALAVSIYFAAEDLFNRANLQGVLSTICLYGEAEMQQVVEPKRNRFGTLTKQAGVKNVKTMSIPSAAEALAEPEPELPPPPEETPEEKREKQKRKQTMVLAELFETEKSFVTDLELLVKKFLNPVLEQSILTQEEANDIFINVRDVWVANRKLLKDLDTKRNKAPLSQYVPISDIFVTKAPNLLVEPYSVYCCNHGPSLESVEKLKKKKKEFQEFLYNVQMNDPSVRGLDLISFLVKPVQRICKYPLLFRELLKQAPEGDEDIPQIKEACLALEKVVEKVNANKRVSESQLKIAETEKSLHLGQEDFTFIAPGRTFIREGDIKKLKLSKGEVVRHAILLSNLFILCKPGPSKGYAFCFVAPLDQVTLKDLPDSQIMKCALEFNVTSNVTNRKLFFIFMKPEDKTAWVKDLNAAIAETTKSKGAGMLSSGTSFDLTDNDQIQLFDIRNRITGVEGINFLKLGRKVLKEGEINMKHKTAFEPYYLYLFNDMVVITRISYKDGKKRNRFVFKTAIPFESLILTEVSDSLELKSSFHLTHKEKKKVYVFAAEKAQEKRDWMKDIKANNIYRFCRNVDEELSEILTEKEIKKEQEKTREKLAKGSGIRRPTSTNPLSMSLPLSGMGGTPKISLRQIEGAKLKPLDGNSSLRNSSPTAAPLDSPKEGKKKERGGLASLFSSSEKKDKDRERASSLKDSKDRPSSVMIATGASSLRRATGESRPASVMDSNLAAGKTKGLRPQSQLHAEGNESSSAIPVIALPKLRPTPKAIPKSAAPTCQESVSSGNLQMNLRPTLPKAPVPSQSKPALSAPPAPPIIKSPIVKRQAPTITETSPAPPMPPPAPVFKAPKGRPLPAPGSSGAIPSGRPLPSPSLPPAGSSGAVPSGRPLPSSPSFSGRGQPLSGAPKGGRPLPAVRGG